MYSFKWIFFVIFIINLYNIRAEISDKRNCFDKECKEPLSYAKTLLRYSSPDERILSFGPNDDVVVYSKEAGSDTSLWGAEIKGRRGYVPKAHVREYKVLRKPKILVETEVSENGAQEARIEPDSAADFDVVDGTTIYYDNKLDISPSSTEKPVLATENAENGKFAEEAADSEEMAVEDDDDDEKEEDEDEDSPEASEEDLGMKKSAETPELAPFSLKVDLDENSSKIEENLEQNRVESEKNEEKTIKVPEVATEVPEVQENSPLDAFLDSVTENPGVIEDINEIREEIAENLTQKAEDSQKSNLSSIPPIVLLNSAVDPAKNEEKNAKEPQNDIKSDQFEELVKIEENPQKTEEIENDSLQTTEKLTNNVENIINTENVTENIENQSKEISKQDPSLETEKTEEKIEEKIENSQILTTILPPLNAFGLFGNKIEESNEINPESSTEIPNLDLNQNIIENIENLETTTEIPKVKVEDVVEDKENVQIDSNNAENAKNIDNDLVNTLNLTESKEMKSTEDLKVEIDDKSTVLNEESYENDNLNANYNKADLDSHSFEESTKFEDSSISNLQDSLSSTSEDSSTLADPKTEDKLDNPQNDLHFEETLQNPESVEETEESPGFLSGILSVFSSFSTSSSPDLEEQLQSNPTEKSSNSEPIIEETQPIIEETKPVEENLWTASQDSSKDDSSQCNTSEEEQSSTSSFIPDFDFDFKFNFNSDIFLYLVTTAVSVILFLFGYLFFDKNQREGPLIARINKLEKELIIALKENEILMESGGNSANFSNAPKIEIVNNESEINDLKYQIMDLQKAKLALEEHVQALEKELDTSTEVGIELNRILSEMLKSPDGDENMKANVELLQRQLVEQQTTIATVNDALNLKETENHELHLELEISNKKVMDLQGELDGMVEKILRIEEERDQQQQILEKELGIYQEKCKQLSSKLEEKLIESTSIQNKLSDAERRLQIKENEFKSLKDSLKQIKLKNSDLKSLLEVTQIKAELEQLQSENSSYKKQLEEEREARDLYEKRAQSAAEIANEMRVKYEQADKEKVEINTKLDVLNNYFKEREAQLQKELSKYEGLWAAKEGEATSTTERFKYMQEELQNYKAQYESLKQEIISQEVDLKSQISMLEKKAHENWVMARQNERKMQDAQQEAAQLRNRLTMRERAFDDKAQNRMTSPLEPNGDLPISPHPIESPASPPLIYGGRDHLTKSPPLPGLPPFLPPPPGAPFMPPPLPLGMPPFMPPPPHTMLPGDHRPPPLGRMSSPPLNSRYSPDSSVFSPYERNSPSPTYDSEYGASPPMRGYSPYRERDDKRMRRDVLRNGRNSKLSSGSDQSIGSIEKVRKPKV